MNLNTQNGGPAYRLGKQATTCVKLIDSKASLQVDRFDANRPAHVWIGSYSNASAGSSNPSRKAAALMNLTSQRRKDKHSRQCVPRRASYIKTR